MVQVILDGVTQRTMSMMGEQSISTTSRYISSHGYPFLKAPDTGRQPRNVQYPVDVARKVISAAKKLQAIAKKYHAFYNFKGGTGKTSICYQVASHLALSGYKILAIDADPQGHLSTSCGMHSEQNHLTLYDGILGKSNIEDLIKNVYEGFDCIPSNLSLTRLEVELNQMPRREERLKLLLQKVEKKYDFIFIDTNPTISQLNRNVVVCSDVLNVVTETQAYSLNGLKLLLEDLNKFYEHMQISKRFLNIIPNKYEDRMTNSAEGMTVLREYYSEFIKPDFAVRKSEDINTSAKLGKPVAFFAKKDAKSLEDIVELINYIVDISSANPQKK